ncbi:hypothetical protein CPB97_011598 [Podila verticillata]|nr:hypothetical protein CPB97_011598 [Podila verticillata]
MNANIPTRWMDLDVIRSTVELRDDNTTSIEVICRWHENDIRLLPDPLANYDDPLGQAALLNMNVGTRIQARGLMTTRALARGQGVRRRPVLGLALTLTDLRPPRGRSSRGKEGRGSSSGGSGGGNKGGEGGPSGGGTLGAQGSRASGGKKPSDVLTVEELKQLLPPPKTSESMPTPEPIPTQDERPVHEPNLQDERPVDEPKLQDERPIDEPNSQDKGLVDEPKGSFDPILNRDEVIEIPSRSASPGRNRPFDPLQNVELAHYHFDGYGRQRPGPPLAPFPRSPGRLYTFQDPDSDVGERWLVLVTSGETESLGNIEVFKEEVEREAGNETCKVVLQRMTVAGSTPLGGMPLMPAKPTRKYFIDESGRWTKKDGRFVKGRADDWRCVFTQTMSNGRTRSVHVLILRRVYSSIPGMGVPWKVQIWQEMPQEEGPSLWLMMEEGREVGPE